MCYTLAYVPHVPMLLGVQTAVRHWIKPAVSLSCCNSKKSASVTEHDTCPNEDACGTTASARKGGEVRHSDTVQAGGTRREAVMGRPLQPESSKSANVLPMEAAADSATPSHAEADSAESPGWLATGSSAAPVSGQTAEGLERRSPTDSTAGGLRRRGRPGEHVAETSAKQLPPSQQPLPQQPPAALLHGPILWLCATFSLQARHLCIFLSLLKPFDTSDVWQARFSRLMAGSVEALLSLQASCRSGCGVSDTCFRKHCVSQKVSLLLLMMVLPSNRNKSA